MSSALLIYLNFAAAAVGTLLAVALLTRSGRHNLGWRLLGAVLLLGIIPIVIMVLYESRLIERYPDLIGVHTPISFLLGPAFYFCVLAFATPQRKFRSMDLVHLLPFMLYVWLLWPVYSAPDEIKLSQSLGAYYADSPDYRRTQLVHMSALLLHFGTYIGVALWRVRGEGIRRLPRLPIGGIIAIWVLLAIRFFLDEFGNWVTADTALVVPTAISILLVAISFQGMRQGTPRATVSPYSRSSMSRQHAREIADILEDILVSSGLYLQPECSLAKLAEYSGYSRHQVSEALNAGGKRNLSDLVNSLRVSEARRRILEERCSNFSQLAADVGFASRSSFYAAFKRHAGCTPGELGKHTSHSG